MGLKGDSRSNVGTKISKITRTGTQVISQAIGTVINFEVGPAKKISGNVFKGDSVPPGLSLIPHAVLEKRRKQQEVPRKKLDADFIFIDEVGEDTPEGVVETLRKRLLVVSDPGYDSSAQVVIEAQTPTRKRLID